MTLINLDEILAKHLSGYEDYSSGMKSDIKEAAIDFGKQLLDAAAEKATLDEEAHHGGFAFTYTVNKHSITSVIEAVK